MTALTRFGQLAVMGVGCFTIAMGIFLITHSFALPEVDEGFALGVLATAVMQSSMVVSMLLVTSNIDPEVAVAGILGANLGTTMTPLVAAHFLPKDKGAMEVASLHFWFNALGLLTLGPIELLFHPLEKLTISLRTDFAPPLLAGEFEWWKLLLGITLIAGGMRWVRRFAISTQGDTSGLVAGVLVTLVMRHSSATVITTAAMNASNRLTIILGANIATTLSAVLLALNMGVGMQVAFTHLLFNLLGVMLVLLFPPIRSLLEGLATRTAKLAVKSPPVTLLVIALVWLALPAAVIQARP
ncbi:hypothetical protein NQ015_05795 [Corynebacterium sp. 153RC1]|uniref:hypothetical protein n=1 Tax=unclassified Corynebacterium TaxID=2624378 RepID=UPI00211C586D|nr:MULTISPECIES: hypothetical protein [unclassified Corynebacterium]MCQ9370983.1 hypothetical protein [Corynebacterium sp. 35RC1]MCQ9352519.1 hypothetical protein [Corynebacterium sp. 209RC1]MCQ9354703.1 hypothetical protein [Corynebacterium sp. 1222RC1]MCQ9356814.1 hypothetical protein [Corynebacterium sp. 122RC1]MCQ9358982.1 hypothetical protein [Corynebacterium sp. 142RC1]